jgi:uncharacterized membrane protein (UPF0136 family)
MAAVTVFWWALASAALMVVGGFGPWAEVLDILTVSGTEGDGWFLIVGGIAAACLVIIRHVTESRARWFLIVSLVLAVIGVLVTIVDLADIEGMAPGGEAAFGDAVSASWGIYVALIASLSLLAAMIVSLVQSRGGAPAQAIGIGGAPGGAFSPHAPAAAAAVAAGWYADPKEERRLRYWDGAAWTDHVAD